MEQQQQWQPPRYEGRGARLRDEHHATLKRRKEAVASWAAGVAEEEHNPVYADDVAPIGPQRYTNALEPPAWRRRTMSDAQERPASSESEAAPAVTAMEAETAALAEAASATNAARLGDQEQPLLPLRTAAEAVDAVMEWGDAPAPDAAHAATAAVAQGVAAQPEGAAAPAAVPVTTQATRLAALLAEEEAEEADRAVHQRAAGARGGGRRRVVQAALGAADSDARVGRVRVGAAVAGGAAPGWGR